MRFDQRFTSLTDFIHSELAFSSDLFFSFVLLDQLRNILAVALIKHYALLVSDLLGLILKDPQECVLIETYVFMVGQLMRQPL